MSATKPQLRNDDKAITAPVYLNGEFLSAQDASISPMDRGFIFGDGVYEVIPLFGGRLFRLAQHLQRLHNSLAAIGLDNPLTDAQWGGVLQQLGDHAGSEDQYVYLQITRGAAPRNHAFPHNARPTVFAYAQPMSYSDAPPAASGIAVITAQDIRWQRCDIKSTSLLAAVMLRQQAAESGAVEAILVRDGLVTEGAASNVFIVRDHTVVTPPKGPLILAGITRELILELAQQHGIALVERTLQHSELSVAEEVWIASSTNEIKPVTRIDGTAVGDGAPGALFARMYQHYQDYKRAFREGRAD
ncbi:MAG: D-amino acid aminotransferase [Gammaproteobacteria bacterium]|nr:MAG: D-amino acid aminotransferase [Gammaproteobacteria bacterium]